MKHSMIALLFAVCAAVAPATADPAKDVTARIITTRVGTSGVAVVINAGSDKGVQRTWHGTVLDGYTDRPLLGGDLVLIRIDKAETVARVKLTMDQLAKNPRVRLSP